MRLLWLLMFVMAACAQDRSQARSMVISDRGIVATSQTLASQAGAQILARGGSAVDAAIAADAVLGVVEPMSCGIGGDLFGIYQDGKTGQLTGLNSSGFAGRAMSIEALKALGYDSMPQSGIQSVTVPGCVEGWSKLHQRFGKLPWSDLFQPAIYFAEHGFPVTEIIHEAWRMAANRLTENKAVYLPHGEAPQVGEVFRDPQYGAALRLIASDGPRPFIKDRLPMPFSKPAAGWAASWRLSISPISRPNGCNRYPPNTTVGKYTSCRRTRRGSRR